MNHRPAFAIPLALLAGIALARPAFAVNAQAPVQAAPHLSKAVMRIPGMTCSNRSCATTVYMALIRLPGVMGVGVDEATQTVTVTYIPARTRPAAFLKAVKAAGFPGRLLGQAS